MCVGLIVILGLSILVLLAAAVAGNWQVWGPNRAVSPRVIRGMFIAGGIGLLAWLVGAIVGC
jgi:hypothetical protein